MAQPAHSRFHLEEHDGTLRLTIDPSHTKPTWTLPLVASLAAIVAAVTAGVLIGQRDPAHETIVAVLLTLLLPGIPLAALGVWTTTQRRRSFDSQVAELTIGSAEVTAEERAGRIQRWPLTAIRGATMRDCSSEDYGVCYSVELMMSDGATFFLSITSDDTEAKRVQLALHQALHHSVQAA